MTEIEPSPDVSLVLDDLWCLCTNQQTALSREEIALALISWFNGARMTTQDGTVLPAQPFQFYVDDLKQRIKTTKDTGAV